MIWEVAFRREMRPFTRSGEAKVQYLSDDRAGGTLLIAGVLPQTKKSSTSFFYLLGDNYVRN